MLPRRHKATKFYQDWRIAIYTSHLSELMFGNRIIPFEVKITKAKPMALKLFNMKSKDLEPVTGENAAGITKD